ncbi:MAG: RNA polymerase sigma factor [Acidobacteria bacterium]|nr:RNA polymerase sigma factor [Acidobacteriota bacterium]
MSGDTASIDSILAQLQAGIDREENFRRLFECYYRPVFRFFTKRGFSTEESDDLTQETFFRVYIGMARFRREARFETWLFQIATNTYRQVLREQTMQKRTGQQVSWESVTEDEQMASDEGEWAGLWSLRGPLDEVLEEERLRVLSEAIEELPEQMRQCLILRVNHELSYRQVAVILGVSVETVKSQLHLARQRLKLSLANHLGQADG